MSDQETSAPAPNLSPVSQEELEALDRNFTLWEGLTDELAKLELKKPRLLMALQRALDAKTALMDKIRSTRNIPEDAVFVIEPETGAIKLV